MRLWKKNFTIDHSQNCKLEGFCADRHDGVRDEFTDHMKLVYNDVEVEPILQDGIDKDASVVVKKLASSIAEKTQQRYSDVVGLLQLRLSFVLLRAALLMLRGSRSRCEKEKWRRRHPAGRAR